MPHTRDLQFIREMEERITYSEFHPTSRDDAFAMLQTVLHTLVTYALTLINAGTGIGKSNMLRSMVEYWNIIYGDKGVVYLFAPNDMIGKQLLAGAFAGITIIDIKLFKTNRALENAVRDALEAGVKFIVYASNIGHNKGLFKPDTDRVLMLMKHLHTEGFRQLTLIDELHSVLTSLVGGINAGTSHAKADMEKYGKIREQESVRRSLNMLETMETYGVHTVACSATLNNVICSKLPSIGYRPSAIQILNFFPVASLYEKLVCEAIDTSDFLKIVPYITSSEKEPGTILLIFATKEDLRKFKKQYREHYLRDMPAAVEITSDTDIDKISTSLLTAKYVLGINLLGTGFDLGTYVKGTKFSLGILFRKFSDKGSQPLSGNRYHALHMEISAQLAQVLGRMRDGGLFLVPEYYAGINLGMLQERISMTIRDGYTQYEEIYLPTTLQLERCHLGILLALRQNIRIVATERPTIDDILDGLHQRAGERFCLEESNVRRSFWVRVIGFLWESYFEAREKIDNHASILGHLGSAAAGPAPDIDTLMAATVARDRELILKGRGFSEGRFIVLRIQAEVKERACGVCIHCGDPSHLDMTVCHIQSEEKGGPYDLDNLGWSHRGCDGIYDGGDLIHDPHGGYWARKRINFHPDTQQLGYINVAYIMNRWAQQKEKFSASEDFRIWLAANDYQFIAS